MRLIETRWQLGFTFYCFLWNPQFKVWILQMEILLISRVLGEQGGAKDRQSQPFHKIQPFLVHTTFSLYNTHLGLVGIRSLGNFCTTMNCLNSNIPTISTNKQRNVYTAMFQYKEDKIEMHIESTGIHSCASSTWPASDSAPTQPGG